MAAREPRNFFYPLLLIFGVLFVVTALAVALVPYLEERARDAGAEVPPSPFRDMLRADGWRLLLFEAIAIALLAVCAMCLDRLRRYRRDHQQAGGGKP
jgi:type II secretory pathway component PulF